MERAKSYISQFSEEEVKQIGWKPFDKEKATVATIASILKPGKTNTASISDNAWVSTQNPSPVYEPLPQIDQGRQNNCHLIPLSEVQDLAFKGGHRRRSTIVSGRAFSVGSSALSRV